MNLELDMDLELGLDLDVDLEYELSLCCHSVFMCCDCVSYTFNMFSLIVTDVHRSPSMFVDDHVFS